jgi:AcrR family transcriptional regulator
MSKKTSQPKIDRRSQRTRASLNEALLDAGMKGEVAALDVGALTQKAGVGRSTFYAHYASKGDFIAASFVEMIARAEAKAGEHDPERGDLMPARFLFAHIAEAREFARSLQGSSEGQIVFAAGDAKLCAIAEVNLARLKLDWSGMQRRQAAIFVVGGFNGLLRWQIETNAAPEQSYAAYSDLVRRTLAAD